MARAPVMPLFTDALIGDTTHLSAEQFGAYVLILIATWRNNGKPLLDDDRQMARICRMDVRKWRRSVRAVLAEMFDLSAATWRQSRLEREWAKVAVCGKNATKNGTGKGGDLVPNLVGYPIEKQQKAKSPSPFPPKNPLYPAPSKPYPYPFASPKGAAPPLTPPRGGKAPRIAGTPPSAQPLDSPRKNRTNQRNLGTNPRAQRRRENQQEIAEGLANYARKHGLLH